MFGHYRWLNNCHKAGAFTGKARAYGGSRARTNRGLRQHALRADQIAGVRVAEAMRMLGAI